MFKRLIVVCVEGENSSKIDNKYCVVSVLESSVIMMGPSTALLKQAVDGFVVFDYDHCCYYLF